MDNNAKLEDLIVEDLNVEEQAIISGGDSEGFTPPKKKYMEWLMGGGDD